MLCLGYMFILFLLFSMFALPVSANLRYLPAHFHDLGLPEISQLQTAKLYDAETESDYLTYAFLPPDVKFVSQEREDFFTGAAGSLGAKRFYINNYLHLLHELSDSTVFRLQWFQEQNFSADHSGVLLEFLFPMGRHSLGVHGATDTFKAKDDIGISYNYHSADLLIRFEATAVDFSRNKRNTATDFFIDKPYSYAISALTRSPNPLYLKAHYEPRFRWRFPDEAKTYERESWGAEVLGWSPVVNYWLTYSEQSTRLNQNFEIYQGWRGQVWRGMDRHEAGFRVARKSWAMGNGEVRHLDLLPFYWWEWRADLRAGYEVTHHSASGDESLRSDLDFNERFEHRLNLAWKPLSTIDAIFEVFFTFDLDKLQTQPWEGGSGRLSMSF